MPHQILARAAIALLILQVVIICFPPLAMELIVALMAAVVAEWILHRV